MKTQITIASAILAVAACVAANAQTSDFTVTVNPATTVWNGTPINYTGDITNTTANTITIQSDSYGAPGNTANGNFLGLSQIPASDITDTFTNNLLANGFITLAPGASTGTIPLFTLNSVNGVGSFPAAATFAVTDPSQISINNPPGPLTGFNGFEITSNTTPEPGTVALFASSALGSLVFLRRRRK